MSDLTRSPRSSRENNGKRTAEGSAARLINEQTGPTRSDTNRDKGVCGAKLPEEVSRKKGTAPKATYKDPERNDNPKGVSQQKIKFEENPRREINKKIETRNSQTVNEDARCAPVKG